MICRSSRKSRTNALFAGLICAFAMAAPPALAEACESIPLSFLAGATPTYGCGSFPYKGEFKFSFCANGRGLLENEHGARTPVFQVNEAWIARTDSFDFSEGFVTSEILELNLASGKFTWSRKTINSGDRSSIRSLECAGDLNKH